MKSVSYLIEVRDKFSRNMAKFAEQADKSRVKVEKLDKKLKSMGSGATSVSGTYPNFTISSTDTNTVPNNATITISAGTDLTTGGNFTTDQNFAETITINHANIGRTNNTSASSPGYGLSHKL